MKKFLGVLLAALIIALGIWLGLRIMEARRRATVAELLPQKTLFFIKVADFKKAREEWHKSDLYAIWREPSVQAWLKDRVAKWRGNARTEQSLEDFLALGPTDGFLALTSLENNEPKLVAGFHFGKKQAQVEQFIAGREAAFFGKHQPAPQKTITYQQHPIATRSAGRFTYASAFDRNWFFIANDLTALKALLDRADHRGDKAEAPLSEDQSFKNATGALPNEFVARLFVAPRLIVDKLLPLIALTGENGSSAQLQQLKTIQSIAGTFGFDRGKMREAIFLGMPQVMPTEKLSRPALGTADTETIFYSASLAHWPEGLQGSTATTALPGFVQQFVNAFVRQNLSSADFRSAFGDEFELLSRWPAAARWPSLVVSLPVKNASQARKIADTVAAVGFSGVPWTRSEKNGVSYYDLPSFSGFMPVTLAFAVSDKKMVAGFDAAAVQAAIAPTAQPSEPLEKSAKFTGAVASLPAADSAFAYIDTQLLFERLDQSLRPLLLMSATLSPALGKQINAQQLPPAADIEKHLSPIVMTQRYSGKGYVRESIGPITFNEAVLASAGAFGAIYIYLHGGAAKSFLQNSPALKLPATSPSPPLSAPPSPTATPAATGSPF